MLVQLKTETMTDFSINNKTKSAGFSLLQICPYDCKLNDWFYMLQARVTVLLHFLRPNNEKMNGEDNWQLNL